MVCPINVDQLKNILKINPLGLLSTTEKEVIIGFRVHVFLLKHRHWLAYQTGAVSYPFFSFTLYLPPFSEHSLNEVYLICQGHDLRSFGFTFYLFVRPSVVLSVFTSAVL